MSDDQIIDASTEDRTLFKHDPLNDYSESIRVICIEPSTSKRSRVHCTVRHVSLIEKVEFVCLSYMWGEPSAKHTILINEKSFAIRQSLMEFLFRARELQFQFPIWIDAICINQDNDEERNAQVRIMNKIYSSASGVIAYPGPCPDPIVFRSVLRTYELLHLYYHRYYKFADRRSENAAGLRLLSAIYSLQLFWRRKKLYQKLIDPYLKDFLNLPYWNRVWIVQEVSLNLNVHVLCHKTLISKSRLNILGEPGRLVNGNKGCWSTFSATRDDDIYNLIPRFRQRECQLASDKVYGLVGMCLNIPPAFPIDYSRSPATVILDIYQHFPLKQISDEYFTYYIRPRDFETKIHSPMELLGIYPYILCYTCFTMDVSKKNEVQSPPPLCTCENYPLRYVFSSEAPTGPGPSIDRPLEEKIRLGYCEKCLMDLHKCSMGAYIETRRLSDTALLFEVVHPDRDNIDSLQQKPKYNHQPRNMTVS